MAAQPASPVPTISPAEMQILISRTGLVLNPGQMADLVLAWRQVAGLIASIPVKRTLTDDAALSFRLPPPGGAAAPAREQRPPEPAGRAGRKTGKAAAKRPAAAGTRRPASPSAKRPAAAKLPAKAAAKAPAARGRTAAKPKAKAAVRKPGSGRR